MDHWLFLLAAATALFVAGVFLKALLGLAFRYVLFFVLDVIVAADRHGGDMTRLVDPSAAARIALAAGLAFGLTSLLLLAVKKSWLKPLLLPVFAVGATLVLSASGFPA
jgi:hypothetical protein